MSEILEMIKNEKVEWKKLGDVCEINKGKQLNRTKMIEDGEYPVINGGVSPSGYYSMFNTKKETITVSQGGASAGYVNFIEKNFWLGAHAFSVIPNNKIIDIYDYEYFSFNRFIYHILKMNQPYLQESQEGAGIPSVSKEKLSKIQVPLISKETQEKIVEILDDFVKYSNELQAELQAELQNRSSQYEYFRDLLLSEGYLNKIINKCNAESKISYVKLKELVDFIVGGDVPKNQFSKIKTEKYNIPIYSNGTEENSLYGYTNVARVLERSITISARGTIGYVSLKEEPYYPIVRLICLIPKSDKLNLDYLYYYLQQYKFSYVKTGIPSLTRDMISNIELTLPNITIQNKVVEVLDKFQDLIADAEGLLPEEIAQRKKQYEYYREKLLTFEDTMVQGKARQGK